MAATTYAKNYSLTIDGVTIGRILPDGVPTPEPEAEKVDDTTQDSGDYYEYIAGRINSGDAELSCIYDEDDAGQEALLAAYAAMTSHTFIKTYPNNLGTQSFTASVLKCSIVTIDKKVCLKAKLAVSGGTTFAKTTAALTTPYFVVKDQANATISAVVPPAAGTSTTHVITTANTVTSVTITPTCATPGAVITVDGAIVATGTASTAKTVTAGTLKNIILKVTEPGKAPGLYRLIIATSA